MINTSRPADENVKQIDEHEYVEVSTLKRTFCSSLNFSMGSTDVKFISLNRLTHFVIIISCNLSHSLCHHNNLDGQDLSI